jgi:hypothetical protein
MMAVARDVGEDETFGKAIAAARAGEALAGQVPPSLTGLPGSPGGLQEVATA